MKKLRVGVVAPPWVPVPPPQYGGTEAVVNDLAVGMVDAGQDVVLFATGDSTCPVPILFAYPRALGTPGSAEAEAYHVDQAYAALEGKVDVIHDHTLVGPLRRLSHPGTTPIVTTVHGPLLGQLVRHYELVGRYATIVAISAAQAASAPTVPVSTVIHHGLDPDRFPLGAGDGGYVAFLGRMNPDKGPHRAIAAARRAGVPIRLAAKMWEPEERSFFATVVGPLLGDDATYVGELAPAERADFLGGAMALLNPIRWPEPFGLVMIEALACGTPVLSFAEGAAPEIVRSGVNGFLCRDEQELAEAVSRSATIEREACRSDALARFSVERMVGQHLSLYRRLVEVASVDHGRDAGASLDGSRACRPDQTQPLASGSSA